MRRRVYAILIFLLFLALFAKPAEPVDNTGTIEITTDLPTVSVLDMSLDYVETPIVTEVDVEPEPVTESDPEPELINLGEFKLTAYCGCHKCNGKWADYKINGVLVGAIEKPLIAGETIAVDPKVIPYNTHVIINGHEYVAVDCGGNIKGNRIDIFFNTHSETVEFGVQYADVFIIREED